MSSQNPRLRGKLLGSVPLRRPDLENQPDQEHRTAWEDPGAQVLVMHDGAAPIRGHRLQWVARDAVDPRQTDPQRLYLLGARQDGTPLFLLDLPKAPAPETLAPEAPAPEAPGSGHEPATDGAPYAGDAPSAEAAERPAAGAPGTARRAPEAGRQDAESAPAPRWAGLREGALDLDPEEASWFTAALALSRWHRSQGFCPSCGNPTTVVRAGWARACTRDGSLLFPRTDPAVIAAVVHTDAEGTERILLGHAKAWPEDRYSTFAGFVEAGETLENAVVREVGEESGVQVTDVEYLGSQPWPFPRSLMLGFRATAARREDAEADGTEMGAVEWFTREELDAAIRSGRVQPPSKVSIAHHLVADWFGQDLPASPKE